MNIEWYPGHIAKAKNEIKKELRQVDIIIELLDARAPLSTKTNFATEVLNNKKYLLILNKSDLSDEKQNEYFLNYYRDMGLRTILLQSNKNDISSIIKKNIELLCQEIIDKQQEKGIKDYILKAMLIGYPNVGKSTFINSYKKQKTQETKNLPGVTKKNQWVKISDNIYLLDTPGITETKFNNDNIGKNLILINSINENLVAKQDICYDFIGFLLKSYKQLLESRYKLDIEVIQQDNADNDIILAVYDNIAKNTGGIKNNKVDYEKTANVIINDFRTGRLGKITLDR